MRCSGHATLRPSNPGALPLDPAGGERPQTRTILGLDHVQLAMPPGREEEARRFYRDLLGLTEAHPAFVVNDLETLALTLREHGHPSVQDQLLAGYDRLYVDDPFGNRIELMQASG